MKQKLSTVLFFLFITFFSSAQPPQYNWAFNVGSIGDDYGRSITLDFSENIYVTGSFSGTADFDPSSGTVNLISTGSADIFVAKYNAAGVYQWAFNIGSTNNNIGYGITTDAIGNVYVIGGFSGITDFDPSSNTTNVAAVGGEDIFIVKYNTDGVFQWVLNIGGANNDFGYAITIDAFGNLLATGGFNGIVDFDPSSGTAQLTSHEGTVSDIFLAKYDTEGNYMWAINIGSGNDCRGKGITTDSYGNVYATGYFYGTADFDPGVGTANLISVGGLDLFVAKYDINGIYQWAFKIGSNSNDVGNGITTDVTGNVYITGYFSGTADFDPSINVVNLTTIGFEDIFVAKYDANSIYQWAFNVGSGNSNEYSSAISLDASANVYITGKSSTTADFDPGIGINALNGGGFVAKYSSLGLYQWAFRSITLIGYGIAANDIGNVHVVGSLQSTSDFDPSSEIANITSIGSKDIVVAKYIECNIVSSIFSQINVTCNGGSNGAVVINANGGIGTLHYNWSPNVSTTNSAGNLQAGQYTCVISDNNSCSLTQNINITQPDEIPVPICLVTVDTLSTHNIIYWEKPVTALIDSFFIYREISANTYQKIGAVPYEDLNEYHDYAADPNSTTYKYKVSVLDTCGFESEKSGFHNTIHLLNLGSGNLLWTQYGIENTGNPVTYYRVYRDDFGTNNFQPINTNIPGGNTTYTDVNYAAYPNAKYLVDVTWNISCTPFRSTVTTTRSNRWQNNIPVGLENELENLILVYPNPASDIITIEFPENMKVLNLRIYNVLGEVVYQDAGLGKSKKQINVEGFAKGIYTLRLENNSGITNRKIILQ